MDNAYVQGFQGRCAACGVVPHELVKSAISGGLFRRWAARRLGSEMYKAHPKMLVHALNRRMDPVTGQLKLVPGPHILRGDRSSAFPDPNPSLFQNDLGYQMTIFGHRDGAHISSLRHKDFPNLSMPVEEQVIAKIPPHEKETLSAMAADEIQKQVPGTTGQLVDTIHRVGGMLKKSPHYQKYAPPPATEMSSMFSSADRLLPPRMKIDTHPGNAKVRAIYSGMGFSPLRGSRFGDMVFHTGSGRNPRKGLRDMAEASGTTVPEFLRDAHSETYGGMMRELMGGKKLRELIPGLDRISPFTSDTI